VEVETTDPPPTVAGTHVSGAPRVLELPARGAEIGRYLVTGGIGRGAMGAVLGAYDADLDRKVAIKLIAEPLDADEDRRKRLLGEAKSMARITHTNVVTVYDAGVWHDRLWVAMELIDGVTLDQWHADGERSVAEIVDAFVAAGRGLAAAHDAGVLHGDFKPSNVMFAKNGRVVVADFGLSNSLESPKPSEAVLESPVGTPAYMSPEHFLGGAIDARADQFAFCVALFEQLTGARPFKGRSLLELASAISQGSLAVAAAAKIPTRVRAVVMRGLSSKPEDRFATMHELIAALESAVRPRWRWQLAIVAAVVLVGAVTWVLARDDERACVRGRERVQAFWNAGSRAGVTVTGEGMTAAALDLRADHLRDGLDRWLGEWIELYDEACRDGAPHSQEIAQRSRVACIENRHDSARGFVELLTSTGVESRRVDALLEVLPDLAECRGPAFGQWEPVPADPELARQVAALRLRLSEARMRRRASSADAVAPEVAAVLASARDSGLSHVVAEALLEHAAVVRAQGGVAAAEAAVDEALDVALRDGHDFLAGRAINRRLLMMQEEPTVRAIEAMRWAHMGEVLSTRGGATDRYLGDFPNNLGIILRHLGDREGALRECHRAEAFYGSGENPDRHSAIGARVNCAAALLELLRVDEAESILLEALAQFDEMFGPEHPDAITIAWNLANVEIVRGERHRALERGKNAMARQLAATGDQGLAARGSFIRMAQLHATVGEIAEARAMLERARAAYRLDGARELELVFAEAAIESNAKNDELAIELLSRIIDNPDAPVRTRDRARYHRVQSEMILARDRDALADAQALCGDRLIDDSDVPAMACYAMGGLSAYALGDRLATATWLAWAEAAPGNDVEDAGMRRLLRFVVSGTGDAAIVRADHEIRIQRTHRDHPVVRMFDRWLASTHPR
jgi:eukaryotic-like serine/threonine-protein kinase